MIYSEKNASPSSLDSPAVKRNLLRLDSSNGVFEDNQPKVEGKRLHNFLSVKKDKEISPWGNSRIQNAVIGKLTGKRLSPFKFELLHTSSR